MTKKREYTPTRVSNHGRFQDSNGFRRKCSKVSGRYATFSCGGTTIKRQLLLHRVVHILFNDPELKGIGRGTTVDHIDRDPDNNRASNLRWATPKGQSENSERHQFVNATRLQRHQILIRRPNGSEEKEFESMAELATYFGCHLGGNILEHVARKGWVVEKIVDPDLDGELWGIHPKYGWHFSNLGRISKSGIVKRFPVTRDASGYIRIEVCGKHANIAHCILEAFGFARPSPQHTADHRNRIRDDNRLANLQWCTRSEQRKNQVRPSTRARRPFEGRAVGTPTWETFLAVDAAAEKTGCSRSDIRNVLNPSSRAKSAGNSASSVRFEFRLQFDPYQEDEDGEVWKDVIVEDWTIGGRYYSVID